MAFVYRAERNINKISNQNTGNTFPGEYFNKSSFIKDIDRQSSEFQSGSKRDLCLSKIENTPGPGSYERNILRYEYPSHHHHKKAKSKDIYEAVKINLIPREILNFLEKKQNIGFNTRGQRFNYKYDMEKSSPGPGSYSPNGSSINGKTDYSTAIFQNNSSKKNQSNNLSNIFPTTYSDYRTETIPSKGNLGYKIKMDKERKAIIKNSDMTEDMQQDAINVATKAIDSYNIEKDIACYIKKEFDRKHNPTWHCIVGRNFGSYVTHETKHFIYFYLGQIAVLLFKSG